MYEIELYIYNIKKKKGEKYMYMHKVLQEALIFFNSGIFSSVC